MILGCWKILAAIVLLLPGFRIVKEWAYAGIIFGMTGAVFSQLAMGEGIENITAPLIFTVLIFISWYFRPNSRKVNELQFQNK